MKAQAPNSPIILISHQPPIHSCADRLASGVHVGSHAIRDFIEAHRPIACLTGHIHESPGIEKQNTTLIVNPKPWPRGDSRGFLSQEKAPKPNWDLFNPSFK